MELDDVFLHSAYLQDRRVGEKRAEAIASYWEDLSDSRFSAADFSWGGWGTVVRADAHKGTLSM